VEVFKSTCGVSIVRDYYKLKKFNVLEVASEGRRDSREGLGALKFGDRTSGHKELR